MISNLQSFRFRALAFALICTSQMSSAGLTNTPPYPDRFEIFKSETQEFSSLVNHICQETGHCNNSTQDPRLHFTLLQHYLNSRTFSPIRIGQTSKMLSPADYLHNVQSQLLQHVETYQEDVKGTPEQYERFRQSIQKFRDAVNSICCETKHCSNKGQYRDPWEHTLNLQQYLVSSGKLSEAAKLSESRAYLLSCRKQLSSAMAHSRSRKMFQDELGVNWLPDDDEIELQKYREHEVFIQQPPLEDQKIRTLLEQ